MVMPAKSRGTCLDRRGLLLTLILAYLVGGIAAAAATTPMPPPTLTPEKIAMGTFYDGVRVRIAGTAPSDSGLLIVIRGSEKDEFFNREGRIGIIWLNADRIHVKQAPSLFISFSSAEVPSLLDRSSLDEYLLDENAVMKGIRCLSHCKCNLSSGREQQNCTHGTQPDPSYDQLLRASFLSLKLNEGSYRAYPRAIGLTTLAGSETGYSLEFQWPRKAPPGDYRVEVYACRDHKVIARSAATLQLVEVGFPAYVFNLATVHPWIYGLASVLVAMLAGLGMDLLMIPLRRRKHSTPAADAPSSPVDPPEVTTADEDCKNEPIHHR